MNKKLIILYREPALGESPYLLFIRTPGRDVYHIEHMLVVNNQEEYNSAINNFSTLEGKILISESSREIKILQKLSYRIDGWDLLNSCFIVNGTEQSIEIEFIQKDINELRSTISTETLHKAILGDEEAKSLMESVDTQIQALQKQIQQIQVDYSDTGVTDNDII